MAVRKSSLLGSKNGVLVFLAQLFFITTAFADFKGFVELPSGKKLYAEFFSPAVEKPTFVLLNGLTYNVRSWDSFVKHFRNSGFGVLRYDMMGHGKTLQKYGPVEDVIELRSQVDDLNDLLTALKIPGSVSLVGLSYGGGLAMEFAKFFPDRVKQLVLMAPYVRALASQDGFIRSQILWTRLMFPFNPATDDQLYDYFLHNIVVTTYPFVEPTVLDEPNMLEATFQLTRGIRHSDFVADAPQFSFPVHLVVAAKDQYVPAAEHDALWKALPFEKRKSRVIVEDSEHKIPEAVPAFAAAWLKLILNNDQNVSSGKTFFGDAKNMEAKVGNTVVKLK